MSPQFVDFNSDGKLDIVAGTFDGSPHVALGAEGGWKQPEQILDRDGQRIMLNAWWDFDAKKWSDTTRCDPEGHKFSKEHMTSALAFDWDADGDMDLILGDHNVGHIYLRINEGSADKPLFATKNVQVLAKGEPLLVPGTVATMRLVDWNGDGLMDLACGSMGDAYGSGPGGGVFLYPNTGKSGAPVFGAAITLVEASKKGSTTGATRPDSGLYMDFGDVDGDGDLDLIVGGYSNWTPPAPELTAVQKERLAAIKEELTSVQAEIEKFFAVIDDATKDLDTEAARAKSLELREARAAEWKTISDRQRSLYAEQSKLEPGDKRSSCCWLYENASAQ